MNNHIYKEELRAIYSCIKELECTEKFDDLTTKLKKYLQKELAKIPETDGYKSTIDLKQEVKDKGVRDANIGSILIYYANGVVSATCPADRIIRPNMSGIQYSNHILLDQWEPSNTKELAQTMIKESKDNIKLDFKRTSKLLQLQWNVYNNKSTGYNKKSSTSIESSLHKCNFIIDNEAEIKQKLHYELLKSGHVSFSAQIQLSDSILGQFNICDIARNIATTIKKINGFLFIDSNLLNLRDSEDPWANSREPGSYKMNTLVLKEEEFKILSDTANNFKEKHNTANTTSEIAQYSPYRLNKQLNTLIDETIKQAAISGRLVAINPGLSLNIDVKTTVDKLLNSRYIHIRSFDVSSDEQKSQTETGEPSDAINSRLTQKFDSYMDEIKNAKKVLTHIRNEFLKLDEFAVKCLKKAKII